MTQWQSVSTFESEVRNSLSALEPHSMDSLGHQHCAKKLSPKIALHFKVLCESKAMLPKTSPVPTMSLFFSVSEYTYIAPENSIFVIEDVAFLGNRD